MKTKNSRRVCSLLLIIQIRLTVEIFDSLSPGNSVGHFLPLFLELRVQRASERERERERERARERESLNELTADYSRKRVHADPSPSVYLEIEILKVFQHGQIVKIDESNGKE
jgi:hypothetical protein